MDSARICLFSGSIATQSQIYSDPTLSKVSSTMNSGNPFSFYLDQLRVVLLNPVPDSDVISLDKTGKPFRRSPQR